MTSEMRINTKHLLIDIWIRYINLEYDRKKMGITKVVGKE